MRSTVARRAAAALCEPPRTLLPRRAAAAPTGRCPGRGPPLGPAGRGGPGSVAARAAGEALRKLEIHLKLQDGAAAA